MGREARVRKTRVCETCNQLFHTDAVGLTDHIRLCVRAAASGLILPGITGNPNIRLVSMEDIEYVRNTKS